MPILIENLSWMLLNIVLALIAVFFSFLLSHKKIIPRIIFFILWLLFVPNTIYLLTDIEYFPEQFFRIGFPYQILLLMQFTLLLIIGVLTFFYSVKLFEKMLKKHYNKPTIILILILMNFLISFGVVLGKIERVNSWNVVTNISFVISSTLSLLSSSNVLWGIFLFGVLNNIIYFLIRKATMKLPG